MAASLALAVLAVAAAPVGGQETSEVTAAVSTTDTVGDAWFAPGDVHVQGVEYVDDVVSMAFAVVEGTPITNPPWGHDESYFYWEIDTGDDGDVEYYVQSGLRGKADHYAIVLDPSGIEVCSAFPDAGRGPEDHQSWFSVSLWADCIGSPAVFSYRLVVRYQPDAGGATGVDWVPDQSAGRIRVMRQHVTPSQQQVEEPRDTPSGDRIEPPDTGYWMLGADGRIWGFGPGAKTFPPVEAFDGDAVAVESAPDGKGYWVLTADGGIHARGSAGRFSRLTAAELAGEQPVSLSAHPSGEGLWVFTSAGGVITRGDAQQYGDMRGTPLDGPVLDSVATPAGAGYYMVASDGGVFTFGDAEFDGSMGGQPLDAPVQALVPDTDGDGYWLVASDGGMFSFDAPFRGSVPGAIGPGTRLAGPVVGAVAHGDGYLMVASDGGIFNFSALDFHGSLGDREVSTAIVDVSSVAAIGVAGAGGPATAALVPGGVTAAAYAYGGYWGGGWWWLNANGDAYIDGWFSDFDGDGRYEWAYLDRNQDARHELVWSNWNDDGYWDRFWVDPDLDGYWELRFTVYSTDWLLEMDANHNGYFEYAEWDSGGDGSREWAAVNRFGNESWDGPWVRLQQRSPVPSTMTIGGTSFGIHGVGSTMIIGSPTYSGIPRLVLTLAAHAGAVYPRADLDGDGYSACRPGESPGLDYCDYNDNVYNR